MELLPITDELYLASKRLEQESMELYHLGKKKAESERDYRLALSQEIFKLRAEKLPATLIPELAKGNVAEQLFQRDLAEAQFKAAVSAMGAIETQVSALQTILKYRTEV